MVQISEGGEPVKVPLVYYDEYGERHEVGSAAVQIKDGEVIAVGKIEPEIEGDIVVEKILGGINLESFSVSEKPFYAIPAPDPTLYPAENPAVEAARRLGPTALDNREYVTESNPNGEVRQCDRRDLHEPHEWQAEFGAYFNVYCPGNKGEKR